MRYFRLLAISLPSLCIVVRDVQGQLDQIPPCALACATISLGDIGCGPTDIACICKAEEFIGGLLPCVSSSCSGDGQLDETIAAAVELCAQAGVTLSVPTVPSLTTASSDSTPLRPPASTTSRISSSAIMTRTTTPRPTLDSSTSRPTQSSTSTPTAEPEPPEETQRESKTVSAGIIAACVLGGIIGIILIAGLIWYMKRRRSQKADPTEKVTDYGGQSDVPTPAPVGGESQGIWAGESPYSWNPAMQAPKP